MFNDAGWSSSEARRAHNPKVTGSNPVPAIFFAQIAQLVEQRTENPRVAGSIPALGTFFMLVRLKTSTGCFLYGEEIPRLVRFRLWALFLCPFA